MLWWNTIYKNELLEKIFTDKKNLFYYKLYDAYYEKKAKEHIIKKTTSLDINTISLDDIKLNIKTDHLSTFKEHYHNFKPTLDQIKNFDSNQLNKVSEMQSFIKSDLDNLFSRPYKEDIRHEYLSKIQENYDKIPDILDYRKILTKVEYKAQNLAQAHDYFVDPNNTKVIQDAFSTFMANVIKKQYDMRNNFVGRVNLASEWISKVTKAIQPGVISLSNLVGKISTRVKPIVNSCINICNNTPLIKNPWIRGFSLFLFLGNFICYSNWNSNILALKNEPNNNNSTAIISTAANRLIEESKSLDNPVTNIGFLIGKVGSSIAKGIFLGVSIKNKDYNRNCKKNKRIFRKKK